MRSGEGREEEEEEGGEMDVGAMGREAQKYVWEGAIPLQIHLHESEVTTLPHPSPALVTPLSLITV